MTKNIYTVRVTDTDGLPELLKGKVGKPDWVVLLTEDAQWSAEAVIPDFSITDSFDLDIIFDDDFRKTADVNIGDRFIIRFSLEDKAGSIREAVVTKIRKDKPINHLQNKDGSN